MLLILVKIVPVVSLSCTQVCVLGRFSNGFLVIIIFIKEQNCKNAQPPVMICTNLITCHGSTYKIVVKNKKKCDTI